MIVINSRNVNHALPRAVMLFLTPHRVREIAPRGDATLEINEPVCTVYQSPRERVLFEPVRDANPFFHFFEALWILAGRNDVAWLANFLPRMAEYSDDGETFHGAYGTRMRHAGPSQSDHIDQLASAIEQLKHEHSTRRAVVALWQPQHDAGYAGKDMPCNCTITFKVRDFALDMHVFNRSNDMLWGAYGANVVQFSTIMEYVAAMLGVPTGIYRQTSDSFHVYPEKPVWKNVSNMPLRVLDPYGNAPMAYYGLNAGAQDKDPVRPYPMVEVPEVFDTELQHFVQYTESAFAIGGFMPRMGYENTYFDDVAGVLLNAFMAYKRDEPGAAKMFIDHCKASDWSLAARLWMYRRWMAKETVNV